MSGAPAVDTIDPPPSHVATPLWTRLALGAGVWVATGAQVLAGRAPVGLLEFLFLLAPLILVPLGAEVIPVPHRDPRAAHVTATLLPFGGVLAAVSFWPPRGPGAVILAGAWALACLFAAVGPVSSIFATAAAGDAGHPRFNAGRSVEAVCGALAFVFLTVGAAWLVMSRAGAHPFGYSDQTVFLAALHFHFTGFVLPATASATAACLRDRGRLRNRALRAIVRSVVIGILAGLPLIAVGNVRSLPPLILAGALLIAIASFGLAGLMLSLLPAIAARVARLLLVVSALSLTVAMVFAAVYAIGQFAGQTWLIVPAMTRWHGAINAAGFGLCGLTGFRLAAADSRTQRARGQGRV